MRVLGEIESQLGFSLKEEEPEGEEEVKADDSTLKKRDRSLSQQGADIAKRRWRIAKNAVRAGKPPLNRSASEDEELRAERNGSIV